MKLPSLRFSRASRALNLALFLVVALEGLTVAAPSQPGPPVTARTLPAQSGVLTEAEILLDAPPERVAALLRDPKNYLPLFPANSVQVISELPTGKVIAVEMKKPWPIGTVSWVEDVVTKAEPGGQGFVVERNAHPGYFRHMTARWRVTAAPGAQGRSLVTYQVAMQLSRWAPELFLKRGNLNGVVDTMNRLRKLVAERGLTAGSADSADPASAHPAAPSAPAPVPVIDSPKHGEPAPSEKP